MRAGLPCAVWTAAVVIALALSAQAEQAPAGSTTTESQASSGTTAESAVSVASALAVPPELAPAADPSAATPLLTAPTSADGVEPIEYRALPSDAEATRLAQEFLRLIMAHDYDAAFARIRPFFPVSEQRFAKLKEEVTKQHGLAELQFGKPIGTVSVDTHIVSGSLLRYRILEKFDWDVMYWEFIFYQPDRGWILNGLGFDDTIKSLFPK